MPLDIVLSVTSSLLAVVLFWTLDVFLFSFLLGTALDVVLFLKH